MKTGETWLDLQTREILQPTPPEKIAPPTSPDYSLILLAGGKDRFAMLRAVQRVNDCDGSAAAKLLKGRLPLVVNPDLSYHNALLGQFEFVCCDAIAVFIASEVVVGGEPSYLYGLFQKLRGSPEFAETSITIRSVPDTEDGRRFSDQFLGSDRPGTISPLSPVDMSVPWKKARIMAHWATRIGATLSVSPPSPS
jgi:hypothetical protein